MDRIHTFSAWDYSSACRHFKNRIISNQHLEMVNESQNILFSNTCVHAFIDSVHIAYQRMYFGLLTISAFTNSVTSPNEVTGQFPSGSWRKEVLLHHRCELIKFSASTPLDGRLAGLSMPTQCLQVALGVFHLPWAVHIIYNIDPL